MSEETVFTNARVVTRRAVFRGSVRIADGRITDVDPSPSRLPGSIDLDGDYLIPGLIELHTDNLEKHVRPRPGVRWPILSAIAAHDAQIVGSGITTVFDAVSAGDVYGESARIDSFCEITEAVTVGKANQIMVADHYLHLRCELSYEGVLALFESSVDQPCVRLVSVMDHSPGQRQFANVDKYRLYYQGKYGLDDDQVEALIRRQRAASERFADRHREVIVAACQERGLPLASHDDATRGHIEEAAAEGVIIAEFPTTIEAAETARERGIQVLMGAPNLVLGGSHSGNVSTLQMAQHRLLNTLSSDYVPASLLLGTFVLHRDAGYALPDAIATVTATPAATVGLDDRGEIAAGKRADLVRVRQGPQSVPMVRGVWREGQRIA